MKMIWLVCVPVQVMFLPQRAVPAPGNSLVEQLIYPAVMPEEGSALDLQHLAHLLQQVGLIDLLQRVQGDWRLSQNWQGMASAFHAGLSWHSPCHRRRFQGVTRVWWPWHTIQLHGGHAHFLLEHVLLNGSIAGGGGEGRGDPKAEQFTTCCML